MVKDLKGILGMVSLDIYQITNYSSHSKEHIIYLIFKRLGFFMNTKVWLCETKFYFKIRLFEISMFQFNWLKKWESIYPNEFVPNNDHKFLNLRQFEKHFFIPCFKNFQNIMHKCLKHKSIHFVYIYSSKDKILFSKSTRKKCN